MPNELADAAGPGPQDAITTGDETIGKPLYLHARTSDIFKHRQWLYLGPHPAPGDQGDPCANPLLLQCRTTHEHFLRFGVV